MAADTMEFLDSRLKAQAGDCTPSHERSIAALLAKIIEQNEKIIAHLKSINEVGVTTFMSECDR